MAQRYEMAVYNINGERLCTLYDSKYGVDGDASGIEIIKERNGWKEIKFNMRFAMPDGSENYRIQFIKNENLLYLYEDDALDIYVIKTDSDSHSAKEVSLTVQVNHMSEELKAKNLYKYFDDENGIGTCRTLIDRALAGSGWTCTYCDTFYEADGTTEKIRSYQCNTKTGAYNMVSGICTLFKARPVFRYDGVTRSVEIHANQDAEGFMELNFGKNMDKIVRKLDGSNIVTRLYVEGEYGDFGYVGIDSVNPTHLPFIFNFDYYKEIGLFTSAHQTALDDYVETYGALVEAIQENTTGLLEASAELIQLIGTCGYVTSSIDNGAIQDDMIAGGDYSEDDLSYEDGDTVALVKSTGEYEYAVYGASLSLSGYTRIIKFIPTITGFMAAHEDLIKVSQTATQTQLINLNEFKKKYYSNTATPVPNLIDQGTKTNRTIYGITFQWNTDGTVCTLTGTNAGNAFDNIFTNSTILEAGKSYRYRIASTNIETVYIRLYERIDASTEIRVDLKDAEGIVTMPDDLVSVVLRIQCDAPSTSAINENIAIELYPIDSVDDLKTTYNTNDLSVVDDENFDVTGLPAFYQLDTVRSYTAAVGDALNTESNTKSTLNDEMLTAISDMLRIHMLDGWIAQAQSEQDEANDALVNTMGSMLRDGYWSDENYTIGQEESLYQDALGVSQTLAFPAKNYTIDFRAIAAVSGYEDEEIDLSMLVRIYDDALKIDDILYVDKVHVYPDNRSKDNVEFTTDLLNLTNKTFSTMIDRIADMATDVKNNRDVYARAAAITKDGKFSSALLEGAINTLTSRINSASSNWSTDEKGNILFTSLDGNSAMMLSGYGFMVANSKNEDGSWNWRTFGTGEGFTADMIVTGFLNAERIEAGSIVTNKLASNVGEELNISSNAAIVNVVDNATQTITPNSIATAVKDDLDNVSSTSQLADSIITVVMDSEGMSEIAQEADKIALVVADGSSSSSLVLTQNMISAIADNAIIAVTDDLNSSTSKYLPGAIISTVTSSLQYQDMLGRLQDAESSITTQETTITQLGDQIELKVSEADLEVYLRATSDGVYVGRNNSVFEAFVSAEGFDVLYYENGRGNTPNTVWEATGYGMRSLQITLDIGLDASAQNTLVRQIGTSTGGMAWV